ncbi:MAG: ParB family chromosome partitioning protein [Alphaproteobacteria bacterium]|jgi:ParB family chromosome partitioning protein
MTNTLGRGLGALLDDAAAGAVTQGVSTSADTTLAVKLLVPSSVQPRREFNEDALNSLTQSIRSQGIIQPLLVRPMPNGTYEIIAGERRWRASQMAGLTEVPVVIRELEDGKALEIAIVENVQRDDLNSIDEADGYLRLVNEFNYTHEEMARVTGKSRSHITNLMRLLSLPEKIKSYVMHREISMGHARALLGLNEDENLQLRVTKQVVKKELSVRETEALVRKHTDANGGKRKERQTTDLATKELETRASQALNLTVSLKQKEGVGSMTIAFKSLDEMTSLLKALGV